MKRPGRRICMRDFSCQYRCFFSLLNHNLKQRWHSTSYTCMYILDRTHWRTWSSIIWPLCSSDGVSYRKRNADDVHMITGTIWAPSQYTKRCLFVRSREVSKSRDWYFKLLHRFEIWQAHRQPCCQSACQISERSDNSEYKSRGFETLRDLTERRLIGYWDGALVALWFFEIIHWLHWQQL